MNDFLPLGHPLTLCSIGHVLATEALGLETWIPVSFACQPLGRFRQPLEHGLRRVAVSLRLGYREVGYACWHAHWHLQGLVSPCDTEAGAVSPWIGLPLPAVAGVTGFQPPLRIFRT